MWSHGADVKPFQLLYPSLLPPFLPHIFAGLLPQLLLWARAELHCCAIQSCLSPGRTWVEISKNRCAVPGPEAELHIPGADPLQIWLLNLLFKMHSCFLWELWNKSMPTESISVACSCLKIDFHIKFPVPSVDAGCNKPFLTMWKLITYLEMFWFFACIKYCIS